MVLSKIRDLIKKERRPLPKNLFSTPISKMFRKDDAGGFALLSVAIMLGVITASASVLISYMLTTRNAGKILEADYNAIQVAEAGVQKALYCMKGIDPTSCGGLSGESYIGETDTLFGDASFTVAVVDDSDEKIILSTGTVPTGRTASVRVAVTKLAPPIKDLEFDFALQVGDEGLDIQNNAEVHNGPIYSNSDIDCANSSSIDDDVIVSKVGGFIDNCEIAGSAYADSITSSEVTGDAYYDLDPSGIQGTSVGGTTYPNSPTPHKIDLPSPDLDVWRNAALAGGTIVGDLEPEDDQSLGPMKVEGDLILGNNIDIIITGPIWVEGDILMSNGSSMALDASFGLNSTLILADNPSDLAGSGKIVLENGSTVSGSGTDGSYILFVSTNTSLANNDPAIEVSNNASGGIFLATSGIAAFSPNAEAAAIVGESVYMKNNAIINYDNVGLMPSDAYFSTAEEGDWRFLEHSWNRL